ncbi:WAT1-related protein At2g39510-like [Mangifera indica]|uniref:WAT1-related protein At2g39510-like n=1 Tax=Mangifera indica TaxID=29780 RepID=UPI001CF99B72|nr:WAT1-related protein At2g39510-like [Mangifera indica]
MNFFKKSLPYLAMIFQQFNLASMAIIVKHALDNGLSPHVLVALRMVVAAILVSPFAIVMERNTRPMMTLSTFFKIVLLSLFEPVLSQNFSDTGMKYTTATFNVSMSNALPAMTFIMAWIFRLEIVKLRKLHGQAKIVGTLLAVGGGIIMTFVKGTLLDLPWKNGINIIFKKSATDVEHTDLMKGAGLIVVGLFCWSCFIILQAHILRSYPSVLSLAALVCIFGSIEGIILALLVERGNTKIWSIFNPDAKLLAVIYGGMMSCSTYLIMGWLMKNRGPVFVTSFNPLGMVLVTIFSSFFLAERLFLGRVLGAAVIIIGLCMVLWGKSKDQRHSNSQNIQDDDAVAAASQNGLQMAVINGDIESPSQSNVTVDEGTRASCMT